MTITDDMHKKKISLREIYKSMRGINPRLSLYKQMESQAKELEKELADMGAKRIQKC